METENILTAEEESEANAIEESLQQENIKPSIKLNYQLKTAEERVALVNQIIESTPSEKLSNRYLEILSDYIVDATLTKEERKKRYVLTSNRLKTVNDRETSFEGLCEKLENGEDGLYSMMSDLGKNVILSPQDKITEKDIAEIPDLARLIEAIASVEEQFKKATGKRKYLLKKQLIEMRQDQYVIRNDFRGRTTKAGGSTKTFSRLDFYDDFTFDECGNPVNNGLLSFFRPDHIEALLCNYTALKDAGYAKFRGDLWYIMEDLDHLIDDTLKEDYPLYYDLLWDKIDGLTNIEIQRRLEEKHGIRHSVEYISSLWRNKIPKLMAEKAQEQYLDWYYTEVERGQWKKCGRCGQVKLAHNKFFSKNKSSKDGWYSLCKECRNAGSKKNQQKILQKSLVKDI